MNFSTDKFLKASQVNTLFSQSEDSELSVSQVKKLKQKAHKSFLQVIQMQNLHQEQIEILKKQHSEKERLAKQQQQCLMKKINQLEITMKNNRYDIEIPNTSKLFGNIQSVEYRDTEGSQIDEESFMEIKQFLFEEKESQSIRQLQIDLKKYSYLNPEKNFTIEQKTQVICLLRRVKNYFSIIHDENCELRSKKQNLQKKITKLQSKITTLSVHNSSIQKQIKFLSQHIKRIQNDKSILDRKAGQLQKQNKKLNELIKPYRAGNDNNIPKCIDYISSLKHTPQHRRKISQVVTPINQQQQDGPRIKKVLSKGSDKFMITYNAPNFVKSLKNKQAFTLNQKSNFKSNRK